MGAHGLSQVKGLAMWDKVDYDCFKAYVPDKNTSSRVKGYRF